MSITAWFKRVFSRKLVATVGRDINGNPIALHVSAMLTSSQINSLQAAWAEADTNVSQIVFSA